MICSHTSSQGLGVVAIAKAEDILGHKSMQIYRNTPEFPAQSLDLILRLVPPLNVAKFNVTYLAACSKECVCVFVENPGFDFQHSRK